MRYEPMISTISKCSSLYSGQSSLLFVCLIDFHLVNHGGRISKAICIQVLELKKHSKKEENEKMGCVSSCFRVEDYEDQTNPTRACPCPRCLVNNFLNLYFSLFRSGETRSLPPSLQATTVSIISSTSYDNFMSNTFHSTPRPLPYDTDPGYFRSRRDSLVSRRDKGSSHSLEEAEPLRSDADDEDSESFSLERNKWANKLIISGDDSKEELSKSTWRILKSKTMGDGNQGVYIVSDDEDVCPTCLEEYTSENPKIVTKCSHHYHLSCIYEWMERSGDCPVCGKETSRICRYMILRTIEWTYVQQHESIYA